MLKKAHYKTLRRLVHEHYNMLAIRYPHVYRKLTAKELHAIAQEIASYYFSWDPPRQICYSLNSVRNGLKATSVNGPLFRGYICG